MALTDLAYCGVSFDWLEKAWLIRETETAFLRLFSEGRLNGTVHTCVGQEFSALAFAGQLGAGDFIFSNHRGHGHYLAFTDDLDGLVAELMGRCSGVCGGIGGSQHLCGGGFFSNGIQGGIVPCAVGHALALPRLGVERAAGVVFIGDGTLGEGAVYESFNLMALLQVPLLVVCEDNGVAQSTPQEEVLRGSLTARARAFGLPVWEGSTDEPEQLLALAGQALDHVRAGSPGFFHVRTARLNAHSKGDDGRPAELVARLRDRDFLNRFERDQPDACSLLRERVLQRVGEAIRRAAEQPSLTATEYLPKPAAAPPRWQAHGWAAGDAERLVTRLQQAWRAQMHSRSDIVLLGEDIRSPYGGAFKVTKGLSDDFPHRVINTPISEAGITGIGNGLALAGLRPVVEIMFGDFLTLALDQLVNHAAKFGEMYRGKAACPLIVRTPMGGGRGYGPTHSQSLEKLVAGTHGLLTVAFNVLQAPEPIVAAALRQSCPVVLIENKLDYGRRLAAPDLPGYAAKETVADFPALHLMPRQERPQATLVTYGGMVTAVLEAVRELFSDHEILVDVVVLTRIGPPDCAPVCEAVRVSGCLITVEEGVLACGLGSEILAQVTESVGPVRGLRIGAAPAAIPSSAPLEAEVLPGKDRIVRQVLSFLDHD